MIKIIGIRRYQIFRDSLWKKIIFYLLFALSYVFADENEILKEKLECFYSDFVSKTMTEHQLIEEYGNPTDIEIIQIGDRGDYIKVYDYEHLLKIDI